MANYNEIVVWFEESKLAALKTALSGKNVTVEQILTNKLDEVYADNVEAETRFQIAKTLAEREQMEAEETARKKAEQYRETAVQIIVDGVIHQWKVEQAVELLQMASALRKAVRQTALPDDVAFETVWTPVVLISQDDFDKLASRYFEKDRSVTGAYVLNFDSMEFCYAKQDCGWMTYPIKDVSTALYQAERKSSLTPNQRLERFEAYLGGKLSGYRPCRTVGSGI